ncbi:MAG: hypothetical protein ACOCZT_01805 [Halanaerobiales bacterium]
MIIVNFLANYLPLNDLPTDEVSDMFPNLFTPAGVTFAIWGVIYFLLFAFIIYQSSGIFDQFKKTPEFVEKIGWWFFISSLANSAWIFSWHYLQISLSLIIMFVLLFSLIVIYIKLNIGRNRYKGLKKFLVNMPFSIYLGWITIATIANINVYLVYIDKPALGLPEVTWTIILLIAGAVVTSLVLLYRGDRAYALEPIWAYAGIILKRISLEPRYNAIIFTAGIAIIFIIILMIYVTYRRRKRSTIFYL